MPPKGSSGRKLGASEPNFAVGAYQTLMSSENRSVVTAIGMFAVRFPEAWRVEREWGG